MLIDRKARTRAVARLPRKPRSRMGRTTEPGSPCCAFRAGRGALEGTLPGPALVRVLEWKHDVDLLGGASQQSALWKSFQRALASAAANRNSSSAARSSSLSRSDPVPISSRSCSTGPGPSPHVRQGMGRGSGRRPSRAATRVGAAPRANRPSRSCPIACEAKPRHPRASPGAQSGRASVRPALLGVFDQDRR